MAQFTREEIATLLEIVIRSPDSEIKSRCSARLSALLASNVPDIDSITAAELAVLPLEMLREFQTALDDDAAVLKARKAKLGSALDSKFGERAQQERLAAKKDSGRINLLDPMAGLTVQCDAKKTVKWDQDKLAEIATRIAAHGENSAAYMLTEYKVRETNFKDWPETVRKAFEDARTVSVSTSYTITETKQ